MEKTNQKVLPFLLILLCRPLEEPENLEPLEKTHGLGRFRIFQFMLLLSHDKPKKIKWKKEISLKECFSFYINPRMPHPICLRFSRKLLLWHEIIYMKCKAHWSVVLANLREKINWIAFWKGEIGSHLWNEYHLFRQVLPLITLLWLEK